MKVKRHATAAARFRADYGIWGAARRQPIAKQG
jgi:hypothetical protein